jgi:D-methionine transport system ATP-binding protein
LIELTDVAKSFASRSGRVDAVLPTTLAVERGEVFGLLGFSGAGKSTLLRLMNLLERPTSGTVRVDGLDLTALSPSGLRQARQHIGMIFQQFNLLAQRTARENVEFALEVAQTPRAERAERALAALRVVGLADKAQSYPAQLSGGQKQRVAIARALVNEPKLLLCDEATSALDPHTSLAILKFLKQLNRERGMTIVIVTHDINVAQYLCGRCAVMEKGRIVEQLDMARPTPKGALARFFFETAKGWTDATELPAENA